MKCLFATLLLASPVLAQQRHLFLDTSLIAKSEGTALHANPAHRRETIIKPDKP